MEELAQTVNDLITGTLIGASVILAIVVGVICITTVLFLVGVVITGFSEHRKKRRYEIAQKGGNG